MLGGIFSQRAGRAQHGGDRLALPAGTIHGDGVLRGGFQALHVSQHAHPGRAYFRQFCARHDRDDAGHGACAAAVDRADGGMRVRASHEYHMHHAGEHKIADVLAAPLHQAGEVGPRHRTPDIAVRQIEFGKRGGHFTFSARATATASTASTIAW
jgi:hypothetical protein